LAALAVLTLAIGATTAIFSVVDAVVLRALPFHEQDRLVAVGERSARPVETSIGARDPDALGFVAPQNYLDWTAQQRVFESIAAVGSGWFTLRRTGVEPESIVPQRVTSGFFDVLAARPAIGRVFTTENEVSGRERVAVLSDGSWRRFFGADPQIVGRRIPLEDLEGGQSADDSAGYEVVGVMPAGFVYPVASTRPTDIWIPYVVPPDQRIRDPHKRVNYLQVIARLKPGLSIAQAQTQMTQIATAIELANPVWNKNQTIGVRPLADHIVGTRIRSWMWLLLGAVGLVLLIACANIANLLLARASARERETSIRVALGASRWRLIRQLLIESLVLSFAATIVAVGMAWWAIDVLKASLPDDLPRVTAIALNGRVLLMSGFTAILTAIAFGLVPAVEASSDLSSALKDGAHGASATARQRLRSLLVVAEIALALVLLVGAALFIGSFLSVLRIDPGFDPSNVLIAQISPRLESRTQPRNLAPALGELVDRAGQLPGVLYASVISSGVPLAAPVNRVTISIPGRDLQRFGRDDGSISIRRVTSDYHRALKIPVRAGRLFEPQDRAGAAPVVILNETAARKFFPERNAIGQVIEIDENRTIVGVVGDVHQISLETDALPEAYVPIAQSMVYGGDLVLKTSANPYDVLPTVKRSVFAVLPDVPLRNVRTMDRLLAGRTAQRKVSMLLLGLFGCLGLVIAAVGIYGVMSHLVTQRTREIGVRMALGANQLSVIGLILRHAGVLVGTGLVLGSLGAWYLTGTARAFLFELQPTDLRAFLAAAVLLSLAALAAAVIPTRRAAAVDPIVALRSD
jgi:putative ABC transport system permease protein